MRYGRPSVTRGPPSFLRGEGLRPVGGDVDGEHSVGHDASDFGMKIDPMAPSAHMPTMNSDGPYVIENPS